MWPQWFKDYLSFHRSERNGIFLLVFVLLGLISFNMYQRFFWEDRWLDMQLQHGPSIIRFMEQKDSISNADVLHQPWIPKTRKLFPFDPNTLDSAGWVLLGFSPKQSHAIIRYRNAGASFRKPEDLKKLFVVDEERYKELEPYVEIAQPATIDRETQYEERPKWERPKPESISVELNSADSTILVQLKGIGPSYAKRILKYRELLGGYVSKDQLLEVYGMDSARFVPIMENIHVDTTDRVRLNVNSADVKELLKHPYIDLNLAKAVVNYREQHGRYRSVQDLRKIHILNEQTYQRLRPYVQVE